MILLYFDFILLDIGEKRLFFYHLDHISAEFHFSKIQVKIVGGPTSKRI